MTTILAKTGMIVEYETNPSKALEALTAFKPDLILLDLYMPQLSGLDLSRIIRQDLRFLSVPIVYLSRETEVNKQLEALNTGADDFLLKPVKYKFLFYSISSRIKRARMLRSYMTCDGLTGLPNHSSFQKKLADALDRARMEGRQLTLALLDLDNFKSVNERYSHDEGDRLLKSLTVLLKKRLGPSCITGRYGGDEFAIVFYNMSLEKASYQLDLAREAFSRINHQSGAGPLQATFSGGCAAWPAFQDISDLTEAADSALSLAKTSGKNIVKTAPSVKKPEKQEVNVRPKLPLPEDDLIFLDEDEDFDTMDLSTADETPTSAMELPTLRTQAVQLPYLKKNQRNAPLLLW